MHSFQNFTVRLIPNHPPPLETRIWKLVVRAPLTSLYCWHNRYKQVSNYFVENFGYENCLVRDFTSKVH